MWNAYENFKKAEKKSSYSSFAYWDRSFDHFTCGCQYVSVISIFGYINVPWNLLRYLKSNHIEVDTKTEKKITDLPTHGNVSSTTHFFYLQIS